MLLPSLPRPGSARGRTSRLAALGALATAGICLTGCGSTAAAPAAAPSTAAAYPVTVSNCGTATTYDRAPTRAVSNDINTTEDMIALGLESHMVGNFGVTGDGPVGQPFPADYLAGFNQVREVSPDYFTLEELVGLHPDFLFAGWNYGLQVGTSLTPQTWPSTASRPWPSPSPAPTCRKAPPRSASTTPTRTSPTWARSSTSAPRPIRSSTP